MVCFPLQIWQCHKVAVLISAVFTVYCSSSLNLHFASPGEMKSRDLQKFAMEAFPSFVTRISAATMQTFLGPDPTVPCVILFTDKETTPPVFAALSVNLRKYRYKFADAHSSDTALMSQFNIKKVSLLTAQQTHHSGFRSTAALPNLCSAIPVHLHSRNAFAIFARLGNDCWMM